MLEEFDEGLKVHHSLRHEQLSDFVECPFAIGPLKLFDVLLASQRIRCRDVVQVVLWITSVRLISVLVKDQLRDDLALGEHAERNLLLSDRPDQARLLAVASRHLSQPVAVVVGADYVLRGVGQRGSLPHDPVPFVAAIVDPLLGPSIDELNSWIGRIHQRVEVLQALDV